MKNINVAVIGTGFIGPAHVEALKRIPGVNVLAVASNDPGQLRSVAQRYGVPRVYASWQAALRDQDVEAIHNCTPNHLHFRINREAIAAGKHVLSEKPLTLTSRESAELVALAKGKGVVNGVNFNYRFYPLIQHARCLVQKGEVGEIYLVHGHYLQDWLYYKSDYNWRLEPEISGASRAMADIGSHWCDLVQFVTGLKITSVCANLSVIHKKRVKPLAAVETFKGKEHRVAPSRTVSIGTEDAGTVLLKFSNGATGALTVSQVSAGRKNREWFEIDGSMMALAWNQEEPNQLWVGHRERPNEVLLKDPSLLHEEARRYAHYPGGHPEGYPDGPKNLFWAFYDHIRSGEGRRSAQPDFPTFQDGHWENLVVEAILASSRKERWVAVRA